MSESKHTPATRRSMEAFALMREELKRERALKSDLLATLQWYADQMCEHSAHYGGCGRLSIDECAGCAARAAIAKAEGQS